MPIIHILSVKVIQRNFCNEMKRLAGAPWPTVCATLTRFEEMGLEPHDMFPLMIDASNNGRRHLPNRIYTDDVFKQFEELYAAGRTQEQAVCELAEGFAEVSIEKAGSFLKRYRKWHAQQIVARKESKIGTKRPNLLK